MFRMASRIAAYRLTWRRISLGAGGRRLYAFLGILSAAFTAGVSFGVFPKHLALYCSYVALLVVWQLVGLRLVGSGLEAYNEISRSISAICSNLTAIALGKPDDRDVGVEEGISELLRIVRETVKRSLPASSTGRISVHLLRFDVDSGQLAVLTRDHMMADRGKAPVPVTAPGVGAAFQTGKRQVVEDTHAPDVQMAFQGRPYGSVVAYPMLSGLPPGTPFAVLAIDSTERFAFRLSHVERQLDPVLEPLAQLLGLTLAVKEAMYAR